MSSLPTDIPTRPRSRSRSIDATASGSLLPPQIAAQIGGMLGVDLQHSESFPPKSTSLPVPTKLATHGGSPSASALPDISASPPKADEKWKPLYKKSLLGTWKKYSVALEKDQLIYYDTKGKKKVHTVRDCTVKHAEGLTNRPFSFGLFLVDKATLLFSADSEKERSDWISSLSRFSRNDLGKMHILGLLEGISDCVVVSDEGGAIIGFNKAASAMFGYPMGEVIGKNVSILMPAPYADLHGRFMKKHLETGDAGKIGIPRRLTGKRKDGSVFPLEISLGKIQTFDGLRFIASMRPLYNTDTEMAHHLIETAQTKLSASLDAFRAQMDSEFSHIRKKVAELEQQNSELAHANDGLHKKIEYHMLYREAAERILRDKQKAELREDLARHSALAISTTPKKPASATSSGQTPDINAPPIVLDREADEVATAESWVHELLHRTSLVLDPEALRTLWTWLPPVTQGLVPTLVYSTSVHGRSLKTFYARCGGAPNMIIMRTVGTNRVLGAYLSQGWERSTHYYGNGQCFLFTFLPHLKKYTWAHPRPTYFMMGEDNCLIIGGGRQGYALWIDDMIERGTSEESDTFDNDPLVPGAKGSFQIAVLEVFAFL